MAVDGLSLLGFLAEDQAVGHLRSACGASETDEELVARWAQARDQIIEAIPGAGRPSIKPISAEGDIYLERLKSLPFVREKIEHLRGLRFAMVEIEPLLSHQLTVDLSRVDFYRKMLPDPWADQDLFSLCLPGEERAEDIYVSERRHSVMFRTRSPNLRIIRHGYSRRDGTFGIKIGVAFNLVHVVRFEDRYYLHNGYHRALASHAAGARFMPAIVRDISRYEDIGDFFVSREVMASPTAPTVGHFALGRAERVRLRSMSRLITVSWTEHVMGDDR